MTRGTPQSVSRLAADALPAVHFRGRLGLWHGAARAGESGLAALDGVVALSRIAIAGVPESWRSGDREARALRLRGAMERVASGVAALGPESAVSLRISCDPARSPRLGVALVLRSAATSEETVLPLHRRLRRAVIAALPDDYRWIDDVPDGASDELTLGFVRSAVELLKPELWSPSAFAAPHAPVSHYYAPGLWRDERTPRDGRDAWPEFVATLLRIAAGRTVVDVTLVGGGAPTPTEFEALRGWLAGCETWSRPQTQRVAVGVMGREEVVNVPADPPAAACVEHWRACGAAYRPGATTLLHAVRVLSDQRRPPEDLAAAVASHLLQPSVRPVFHAWVEGDAVFERALNAARNCAISPAVSAPLWQAPDAPETLRRIHRMTTPEELGALWSLPASSASALAQMPVDRVEWRAPGTLHDLLPRAWWDRHGHDGIEVPIGWARPADVDASPAVHALVLDDQRPHVLVAGRSGMGKSTALHAFLLSACAAYPPEELQLYLIDLNPGGLEFRCYDGLPHTAVICAERDASFAVEALEELAGQARQRGVLLERFGAFARYRASGGPLPRIVAVIDEFQVLFEERANAARATAALDLLALQGRKFGIHVVLATQSLAADGMASLSTRAQNQFAVRVALPMNTAADAARVLAQDPEDILSIRERGEAIYADGVAPRNRAIRVAYARDVDAWSSLRDEIIGRCQRLASERGLPTPAPRGLAGSTQPAAPPALTLESLLSPAALDRGASARGLVGPIGRELHLNRVRRAGEASRAVELAFHDQAAHALVAGRAGSGKSSLYHALIASLCSRYSPEELELYLIDMKGPGFEVYRDLPHARLIALGNAPKVALTVLRQLMTVMQQRNARFGAFDAGIESLEQFRAHTGEAMPRVLMIIDEFQQLFAAGGAEAREARALIRDVSKLGRSAGLHLILATQSMASAEIVENLDNATKDQFPLRLAFMMSSASASSLLTLRSEDAEKLTQAGEAVVEFGGSHTLVRVAFDKRAEALDAIRARFGKGTPKVFRQGAAASFEGLLQHARGASTPRRLQLALGERMDAGLAPAMWSLHRGEAAHMLVVGGEEAKAIAVVRAACASLLSLRPRGACAVSVVNLAGGDAAEAGFVAFDALAAWAGEGVEVKEEADFAAAIKAWCAALDVAPESLATPRVLCLFGTHGARATRGPIAKNERDGLVQLLRDGPRRGIFVVAWSRTLRGIVDALDNAIVNASFDTRVGCTPRDLDSNRSAGDDAQAQEAVIQHMDRPEQLVPFRLVGDLGAWLATTGRGHMQ